MDVCICFLKQIAKVHFFFELASNNMSCRFLLLSVAGLFIHAAGCEAGRITISLTYRLFGKNNELNAYKLFFLCIFASPKNGNRSIAGGLRVAGGKSGQHRVAILPNGKGCMPQDMRYSKCHRKHTATVRGLAPAGSKGENAR